MVRRAQTVDTLGGGIDKPSRVKNLHGIWPDLLDTNCLQILTALLDTYCLSNK